VNRKLFKSEITIAHFYLQFSISGLRSDEVGLRRAHPRMCGVGREFTRITQIIYEILENVIVHSRFSSSGAYKVEQPPFIFLKFAEIPVRLVIRAGV
jgi:hypothetical protein